MRQLKITQSITNRESESLQKYLQEINKIQLITPEEEVRLALLVKLGDQKALHKLTNANLRFVVSVAKQYQSQGLPLSDLINEGNLGLIKAARLYDPSKGFKFISYAIWWIRQSILFAIAEQGRVVRLPLNKVGQSNALHKKYVQLEQQLEREPSAEELAEELDVDVEEVVSTLERNTKSVSMDAPFGDGEDGSLLDVLENPNAEKADRKLDHVQSLKTEVNRSLATLSQPQQNVICYFFGIGIDRPLTLEDIGARMNLSRERIRQIKDKAIEKLKSSEHSNLLKSFMGA